MIKNLLGLNHRAYRFAHILGLLSLAFILVGCRQIQDFAQNAYAEPGPRIYGDHTVGQTFVARHDNLRRVDVMLATYARLQLHPVVFVLKESPAATEELARVTTGPLTVQDNAFHPFRFPPIPNSAGHSYYFEIQSPAAPPERPVTVWYQPSDVYPKGEGYVEGRPVAEGDMAFRTYYDPGSLSQAVDHLRARLPEGKPGIWGKSRYYDLLFALYGALIGVFFVALLRLARRSADDGSSLQAGLPWLRRHWLLLLLLALAMVRGVIYASVTYPWQVPDEHGHYEYARLMAEQRRVPGSSDMSPSLQQEVLASMYAFDFWHFAGQATPGEPPSNLTADPYLQYSRPQIGDEPPLYYVLPALSYAFTRNKSIEFQLYAMRAISVLFVAITVWLCYWAARELFGDRKKLLMVAVPALVALLPMFTYIGSGVSNDVAAAAAASWVFLLLARLYRRGVTWYRVVWLLVAVGLALLVKKTNLFLVPSVALAAIVYVRPRLKRSWVRGFVRAAAVLLGAIVLLLAVLSRMATSDAWAWQERPRPWMQTRSSAYSRTGEFSIHLKDDSVDWARKLVQAVPPGELGRIAGQSVTLSAWVRGDGQPGMLLIRDSETETATSFVAGPSWTHVSVSHIIDPRAVSMDIVLIAGSDGRESRGDLYFDDVTLLTASGGSAQASNLLRNGSAEISKNLLEASLEYLRAYFGIPVNIVGRLLDVRYYTLSQARFYMFSIDYAFDSFWARFAQQAFVVSKAWYCLWAAITLLAFVGAVTTIIRGRSLGTGASVQRNLLLVMGVALLIITIQTLVPMLRLVHNWMPQGRYIFPAVLPISVFLVLGIRQLFPAGLRDIGVLALVTLVGLFDVTCLFYYIIPYFHG